MGCPYMTGGREAVKGAALNIAALNRILFVRVLSCDRRLAVCRQTSRGSEQKWKL